MNIFERFGAVDSTEHSALAQIPSSLWLAACERALTETVTPSGLGVLSLRDACRCMPQALNRDCLWHVLQNFWGDGDRVDRLATEGLASIEEAAGGWVRAAQEYARRGLPQATIDDAWRSAVDAAYTAFIQASFAIGAAQKAPVQVAEHVWSQAQPIYTVATTSVADKCLASGGWWDVVTKTCHMEPPPTESPPNDTGSSPFNSPWIYVGGAVALLLLLRRR